MLFILSRAHSWVKRRLGTRCSGLDASIYELYLANIYLDGPSLTFTYFGSQVNTQWDANFQLVNGQWQKANF